MSIGGVLTAVSDAAPNPDPIAATVTGASPSTSSRNPPVSGLRQPRSPSGSVIANEITARTGPVRSSKAIHAPGSAADQIASAIVPPVSRASGTVAQPGRYQASADSAAIGRSHSAMSAAARQPPRSAKVSAATNSPMNRVDTQMNVSPVRRRNMACAAGPWPRMRKAATAITTARTASTHDIWYPMAARAAERE